MNAPSKTKRNGSQLGRLMRLAKKELVEILRDRRTIITLVMMPLLVYPLMGVVVQKLLLQSIAGKQEVVYNIGFRSKNEAASFSDLFRRGDQAIKVADSKEGDADIPQKEAAGADGNILAAKVPELEFYFAEEDTIKQYVQERVVDIGVLMSADRHAVTRFEIIHDPGSQFSYDAMQFVGRRLRVASDGFYHQLLEQRQLSGSLPGSYVESAVETKPGQLI